MTKLNEIETTLLDFILANDEKAAVDLVNENHNQIDFSKKIVPTNYHSHADNDTFLMWAIAMKMKNLSKLILKYTNDADIAHVNYKNETALITACGDKTMHEIAIKLIDTGHSNPSVVADYKYFCTALSLATVHRWNEVIKKLLKLPDMTPECVDFYAETNPEIHNYGNKQKTAFDIATDIVSDYSITDEKISTSVIFEFIKYYYRRLPLSATFLRNINKLCSYFLIKQNFKKII